MMTMTTSLPSRIGTMDNRPLWPRNVPDYQNAMQEAKDEFALWELAHSKVGQSITVYSRKDEDEDDAQDPA